MRPDRQRRLARRHPQPLQRPGLHGTRRARATRSLTGWLNRYLEASRKKPYDAPLRGLSALSLLPRALRGDYPVLAGNNRTSEMDLFEDLYATQNMVNMTAREGGRWRSGSRLERLQHGVRPGDRHAGRSTATRPRHHHRVGLERRSSASRRCRSRRQHAERRQLPRRPAGHQLSAIARVIKANVGLEVAQADYGGWDHHRGEGGANGGRMQPMLATLAERIAAFQQDLGHAHGQGHRAGDDRVRPHRSRERLQRHRPRPRLGSCSPWAASRQRRQVLRHLEGPGRPRQAAASSRCTPTSAPCSPRRLVKMFHFDPFKPRCSRTTRARRKKDFVDFMNQTKEA